MRNVPGNTIRLSNTDRGARAGAALLRAGGLTAFPTETVYGLGADAANNAAAGAIYTAKGRPAFNPLIVHVADIEAAEALIVLDGPARDLAAAFWPGPLTLVAPMRDGAPIAPRVTAGLETLAVRIPAHPAALRLLRAFGGALAAPSANRSGRISPTTADHVLEDLGGRIDAVMDGGPCGVGLESTIVGVQNGAPVILRDGGLTAENITAVAGPLASDSAPDALVSPGRLLRHYAPQAALRLNAAAPEPGEAWLGFGPFDPPLGWSGPMLSLSETGDLHAAATQLYAALRELDAASGPQGRIAAAAVPHHGLGAAINDRLTRAARGRGEDAPAAPKAF